jgi:catecholate siderophore receptor
MDMGGGVPGRNSAVSTDKMGAAATITFGLQTPTRVTLNYYHFEDKSTPDYGIPVDYLNTGLPLSQMQGVSTENFYGIADRDFRRAPVDSGEVRFEHDFNDAFTLRNQIRDTVYRLLRRSARIQRRGLLRASPAGELRLHQPVQPQSA